MRFFDVSGSISEVTSLPSGNWILNMSGPGCRSKKALLVTESGIEELPRHYTHPIRNQKLFISNDIFGKQGRRTYIGRDGRPTKKKLAVDTSECLPHPEYYCFSIWARPILEKLHGNGYHQYDRLREIAILSLAGIPDGGIVIFHYPTMMAKGINFGKYSHSQPSCNGMTIIAWEQYYRPISSYLVEPTHCSVVIFDNPLLIE